MSDQRPVILGFDGSAGAEAAIAVAGTLLAGRPVVVVTAFAPAPRWEAYDPGAVISAGLTELSHGALGLDEAVADGARAENERGVELCRAAGFAAPEGRVTEGPASAVICELAEELDAAVVVVGARGLSEVRSLLLGSVSRAVTAHAHRPVLVVPHDRDA